MMSGEQGIDIERTLALGYAPAEARQPLAGLWTIDAALGAIVAGGGPAAIREIKLVWWRDALAALRHAPPPAQPVLEAAAGLVARGIGASALSALEEPWAVLLSEDPLSGDDLADYAHRGRRLFRIAAQLLGGESDERVERGGEVWALVDLARRSREGAERQAALTLARNRIDHAFRWPRRLRSLGMLVMLAARDADRRSFPLEPQGAPRRMARMLRHRLTGR